MLPSLIHFYMQIYIHIVKNMVKHILAHRYVTATMKLKLSISSRFTHIHMLTYYSHKWSHINNFTKMNLVNIYTHKHGNFHAHANKFTCTHKHRATFT